MHQKALTTIFLKNKKSDRLYQNKNFLNICKKTDIIGQKHSKQNQTCTFNTRTAGVAISPQWPAAVILTAFPKTCFY